MADTGASVIVASHNLYETENICDTIGMLNGKKLVFSCDIDTLKSEIKKYQIIFNKTASEELLKGIQYKSARFEGTCIVFASKDGIEKIKAAASQNAEILSMNEYGMSLTEIFIYETEGKKINVEGLFSK
ncbi:MAG: hypothetical protein VB118_10285 [Oscillospiraceae bacterium]|nr:hypothetical protein [Oscillospiraceae bacterium]